MKHTTDRFMHMHDRTRKQNHLLVIDQQYSKKTKIRIVNEQNKKEFFESNFPT